MWFLLNSNFWITQHVNDVLFPCKFLQSRLIKLSKRQVGPINSTANIRRWNKPCWPSATSHYIMNAFSRPIYTGIMKRRYSWLYVVRNNRHLSNQHSTNTLTSPGDSDTQSHQLSQYKKWNHTQDMFWWYRNGLVFFSQKRLWISTERGSGTSITAIIFFSLKVPLFAQVGWPSITIFSCTCSVHDRTHRCVPNTGTTNLCIHQAFQGP